MIERITILGAGAFGTAVATLLAHKGHEVLLWCREPEIADTINTQHYNPVYLSSARLAPSIKATTDLQQACAHADYILETVPVAFLAILAVAKPITPWMVVIEFACALATVGLLPEPPLLTI